MSRRGWNRFLRDDPSTPLGGIGMEDDRATIMHDYSMWMSVLRRDPCAYCGRRGPAGTVDHIEPKVRPNRTTHTWLNLTAACDACNNSKSARKMLQWLLARAR